MYGKRALVYGITILALAIVAALAIFPFEKVAATTPKGLKVTNIAATPNTIAPIDVLTISTTMTNDATTTDGLTVRMLVRDQSGRIVLEEKQRGLRVPQNGKQSVYWTWRIPNRLEDGAYSIEMIVSGGGEKVLATETRYEAFQVDRTGSVFARSAD